MQSEDFKAMEQTTEQGTEETKVIMQLCFLKCQSFVGFCVVLNSPDNKLSLSPCAVYRFQNRGTDNKTRNCRGKKGNNVTSFSEFQYFVGLSTPLQEHVAVIVIDRLDCRLKVKLTT